MNVLVLLLRRAIFGAMLAFPAGFLIAGGFSATLGLGVLGIGAFIALFGVARAGLVAFGTLLGGAMMLLAVYWLPDAFYRPHERFSLDDRYPANLDVTMDIPFGDIIAVGGPHLRHLAEPRTVRFRTDSLGFRNDHNLGADDIIIVGDSFVAGHGSDQPDLLVNYLATEMNKPVYGFGFPGDFAAYARMITSAGKPAWILAFEGNDFADTCSRDVTQRPFSKTWATQLRRAVPLFAKSRAYTIRARSKFRAIVKGPQSGEKPAIGRVRNLGGKSILLFGDYEDVSMRTTYQLPPCAVQAVEEVAHLVEGIFFIPTKSRLYHGLMKGDAPSPLPHANWQALVDLGAATNVPVFDLTHAMRQSALNAYARDGSLLFWRDDTHWNGRGAAAAAKSTAAIIGQNQ